MNTSKKLIAGTACAVVVTAAGATAVHTERPIPRPATSSVRVVSATLVTPNSLYTNIFEAPAIPAPTGIRPLPGGFYVAPVATVSADPIHRRRIGGPDTSVAISGTSMSTTRQSFAPTTLARPTSPTNGRSESTVGSQLASPARDTTSFGLFSPTGAFLGLVGPGGLLVGDGVLPGQDGGILIGNGADGGESQDGGDGGFFYGNGGNGGIGKNGTPARERRQQRLLLQ